MRTCRSPRTDCAVKGLTAKMKEYRWVKPLLAAQFEFAELTPDNHLRHFRFISLREDKGPREVRRETYRKRLLRSSGHPKVARIGHAGAGSVSGAVQKCGDQF
jgi:ATP-dependent DNA ligase